jgi:nucleoside-diphosphate-sugar epimerase
MNISISVLGCGWLGFAVSKHLTSLGYLVKGSTTSPDKMKTLDSYGIKPYNLAFEPELRGESGDFWESDILMIMIPPQVRAGSALHPAQIQNLIKNLSNHTPRVLYTSSTSVYPELNQIADEYSEVVQDSVIIKAENLLKSHFQADLSIFRLGGLMGYGRIPGKYVAGKKGLDTAEIPVNFVHRDDIIRIIELYLVRNLWGEIFNVVAPIHPLRKDIYRRNSTEFGYEMPEFIHNPFPKYKIVSSQKLIDTLNYTFQYPDPIEFKYD